MGNTILDRTYGQYWSYYFVLLNDRHYILSVTHDYLDERMTTRVENRSKVDSTEDNCGTSTTEQSK